MSKIASKKAGIKDIAARAGISIGTVDRVLHNRGEVKEETRQKILKIIDELAYKPNILAKSLASKKITRIAIVVPDSSDNNPYWEIPIQGIKIAAEELASFNTEIDYVHFDASSELSFNKVLAELCKRELDGIVLNPVFKSTALKYLDIFNTRNIPYVFIDINIKGVGKLGYFGQDAELSGTLAARLMNLSLHESRKVLILKQANKKIFSRHIEARIAGFCNFFTSEASVLPVETLSVEIDLLSAEEPAASLTKIFTEHPDIKGIFVPNSRAFILADYLKNRASDFIIIGYDILERNIDHLKKNNISYLISQKPEVQAYNAIMALFDHLVFKKAIQKTNYSPIDIIVKENLEYYKKQ